jgi:hypothetical protein
MSDDTKWGAAFDQIPLTDPFWEGVRKVGKHALEKFWRIYDFLEETPLFKAEMDAARKAHKEQYPQFYQENYGRVSERVHAAWIRGKFVPIFSDCKTLQDAIEEAMAEEDHYRWQEIESPIHKRIKAEAYCLLTEKEWKEGQ